MRCQAHLKALLEVVVTYLPRGLVQAQLDRPTPGRSQGRFHEGTVMFADVSGFTAMSERFAQAADARAGAEEITEIVNRYFEAMIGIAQTYGGDLLKFGGDALLTFYTGPEAALRACQAALAMQETMDRQFAQVETSLGPFPLRMSIGLGSGEVFLASLGSVEGMEYAVMGPALVAMGEAESLAQAGMVILDRATWEAAGPAIEARPTAAQGFYHLRQIRRPVPPQRSSQVTLLPPLDDPARAIRWLVTRLDALTLYLPDELLQRIRPDPHHIEPLDERRPVTVLFAGLHGVERTVERMGRDQAEVLTDYLDAYFNELRAVVRQYGGVVNKIGAGPAGPHLMALFGAPRAHEDDPERAVRAALEMREVVPTLRERFPGLADRMGTIGINSGNVFAANVGSATRREYTVMGDEVNLAFRLMTAGQPDEVLVRQETTAQEVQHRFFLEPLAPVRVKGKAKPIAICRVTGLREIAPLSRDRGGPLVGRDAEMEQALQVVGRARQGEGQVLTITGGVGMGKSRFAEAVIAHCQAQGMAVLSGTCLSYGREIPYLPWAAILRVLFGLREGEPPEARRRRLTTALASAHLEEWGAVIGEVIGISLPESPLSASLDPRLRQQRFFDITLELLRRTAGRQPLALLIEDVQWIDPASLALLNYVARNIARDPILLLIAQRPEGELDRAWTRLPHHTEIVLGELSLRAIWQLVAALLETDRVPPAIEEAMWVLALGERPSPDSTLDTSALVSYWGTPFFTEERVRALIEAGIWQRRPDGQWEVAVDVERVEFPETLQGIILSRIDRHPEPERRTLRVASVIGRIFAYMVLENVYPYGDRNGSLKERLDRLIDLGVTLLSPDDPVLTYIFRHAPVRDVVYESIPSRHRRMLHQLIGDFLEATGAGKEQPGLLAYHYYQGQDWEKALEYALEAGKLAQREYANDTAIAHYRRALEAADHLERDAREERLTAWEGLGDVLSVVGEYEEALRYYTEARTTLEAAEPSVERDRRLADLYRKIASVHTAVSDYETTFAWLEKGLRLPGLEGQVEQARLYLAGAGAYHLQGKNDQAFAWCQQALQVARPLAGEAAQREMAHALYLLGAISNRLGENQQAIAYCEQSLALYEVLEDANGMAQAHINLASSLVEMGAWDQAAHHYREALKIKQRIGDAFGQGLITNNLGEIHRLQGDLEQAERFYRQSLEIWERLGSTYGIAFLHNNLGAVYHRRGEPEKALTYFQKSLRLAEEIGSEDFLAELYRNLALVHLELGEVDQACDWVQRSLTVATEQGMRTEEGITRRVLGQVLWTQGRRQEAQEALAESARLLEEADSQYELGRTWLTWARFLVAEGAKAQAIPLARRAYRLLEKVGVRQEAQEARELAEGAMG